MRVVAVLAGDRALGLVRWLRAVVSDATDAVGVWDGVRRARISCGLGWVASGVALAWRLCICARLDAITSAGWAAWRALLAELVRRWLTVVAAARGVERAVASRSGTGTGTACVGMLLTGRV